MNAITSTKQFRNWLTGNSRTCGWIDWLDADKRLLAERTVGAFDRLAVRKAGGPTRAITMARQTAEALASGGLYWTNTDGSPVYYSPLTALGPHWKISHVSA